MQVIRCAGREELSADEAAAVGVAVRDADVILFPTDTLYGLGADPFSEAGAAAICRLKGRAVGKPLPVLIADASLVARFAAAVPAPWETLMARFWPGPLTLLFPALPGLPPGIRAAAGTVALRVPGSALCRAVLRAAGGALTGTSANRSGAAGTGDPGEALRDLAGPVGLIVNAGTLPPSAASTIVAMREGSIVTVLRVGAVAEDDLRLGLADPRGSQPENRGLQSGAAEG